jgi:V8-like Glu-specific endopeptidase
MYDQRAVDAAKERASRTSGKRQEVLDRYRSEDWTNLTEDVEQTARALEHVRRGDLADQYRREARELMPGPMQPRVAGSETETEALEDLGELVFEQLIGHSEIMPVRFIHRGSRAAPSIARIVGRAGRHPIGTGFLVSPNVMLTNFHVLEDHAAAAGTIAQFEFAERAVGSSPTPVEFAFQPERLFLQSPIEELDFTLVAVEPKNLDGATLDRYGWCPLIAQPGKEHPGQRVNVIHHPDGDPKQVSLRENFLVLILDDHLHYMTDTMPGSSGSPVFNDAWEVVALHHAGVDITDEAEIEIYRDAIGAVPAGADNEAPVVSVNEGARISKVVANLQGQAVHATGEASDLLTEVLAATPPASETIVVPDAVELVGPGVEPSRRISTGWGTVTITLNPGDAGPSYDPRGGRSPDLELFKGEGSKSVIRGLVALQRRREERYLPTAAEIAERKNDYYGDLPDRVVAGAVTPDQLYDELNELVGEAGTLQIASSFPERLEALEVVRASALESVGLEATVILEDARYDRSRAHLYTWVDLQEHRMLECVYTNTVISPEQLLLKDLVRQVGLEDELPQRFKNDQFLNCEHIVPQSWFGHESIAKADLHHLITADGAANNFRSSAVYRELDGAAGAETGPENRPEYIAGAGRRVRATEEFEPAGGKHVVARATLYFLIAHKEKIDASKYAAGDLAMLAAWSDGRGPETYELHRNETIFEIQGNRNPLIDFPDWVHLIDFARGMA